MTTADIVAVLLAVSLPWSTSLVGIFGVVLVLVMLPAIDAARVHRVAEASEPVLAPIALFALALVGTLWSDARWGMRFYSVAPTAKLLLLPLLFYHFERSRRGLWVFTAFLASCAVMVVVSWIVAYFPESDAQGHGCRLARRLRQELYRPEPGIRAVRRGARLSDCDAAARQESWLWRCCSARYRSVFSPIWLSSSSRARRW